MVAIHAEENFQEFRSQAQVRLPPAGTNAESRYLSQRLLDLTLQTFDSDIRTVNLDSAVTMQEKLFNKLSELKIIVSKISMHLSNSSRKELFSLLDELLNFEDWDTADPLVETSSFITFLHLVLESGLDAQMSLGVSNRGNLLAGWITEKDQLSLEFSAMGYVFWSVVRHFDGRVESAVGRTSVSRLSTILSPYNPEIWFGTREQRTSIRA